MSEQITQLHHVPQPDAAQSQVPVGELELPPNLTAALVGIDATGAAFASETKKAGLFSFGKDRERMSVHWHLGDADHSAEYAVPTSLVMVWEPRNDSFTVAGESKASFLEKLVTSIKVDASYGGFSGEFGRTFQEKSSLETFLKYAAHYERQQVYQLEFVDDPQNLVSKSAQHHFDTMSAAEIVDRYGTHYTKSAMMGGMQIVASDLDVRDELEETDVSMAIKLRYDDEIDGSAGTDISTQSQTVQKLYKKMTRTYRSQLGEQQKTKAEWLDSLFTDPVLVGYELGLLSELITDADKCEAVKAEILRRLAAARVDSQAEMLAMQVPIERHANDHMTGADKSIGVGQAQPLPGWFHIGHWAGHDPEFPGGYSTLVYRNPPKANQRVGTAPALRSAERIDPVWQMRGMGFYRAAPIDGYVAVGDLFDEDDRTPSADYYGMVREDLVVPSHWLNPGDSFWDDSGTGSGIFPGLPGGQCAAFTFAAGEDRGASEEDRTLWRTGGGEPVYMFKAFPSHAPEGVPVRIDLKKVHVLTSSWLE